LVRRTVGFHDRWKAGYCSTPVRAQFSLHHPRTRISSSSPHSHIGIPLAAALAKLEEALPVDGYALEDPVIPDPVIPVPLAFCDCSLELTGVRGVSVGGAEAGGVGGNPGWADGMGLVAWVVSMAVELVR
jgi:hypothetical protein